MPFEIRGMKSSRLARAIERELVEAHCGTFMDADRRTLLATEVKYY